MSEEEYWAWRLFVVFSFECNKVKEGRIIIKRTYGKQSVRFSWDEI